MTEEQIKQIVENDERSFDLLEREVDKAIEDPDTELRIIRTARTHKEINAAALQGFRPLLKRIEPSDEIQSKYTVWQEKETGVIEVQFDYREGPLNGDWEQVIDWTYYYPHSSPNPFAAYLIPRDLVKGELVYLKDIIEDITRGSWNQGNTFRLDSCEAIWNGEDFEIQFDPELDQTEIIG